MVSVGAVTSPHPVQKVHKHMGLPWPWQDRSLLPAAGHVPFSCGFGVEKNPSEFSGCLIAVLKMIFDQNYTLQDDDTAQYTFFILDSVFSP